ncbi:MAG: hypothetical protein RIS76_344 [Verrucomicrobiota bacterium]
MPSHAENEVVEAEALAGCSVGEWWALYGLSGELAGQASFSLQRGGNLVRLDRGSETSSMPVAASCVLLQQHGSCQNSRIKDQSHGLAVILAMTKCLLFIASDSDRRSLVDSIRVDGASVVETFDATATSLRRPLWHRLLSVAHHGTATEVRLTRLSDIPGGVWSWVQQLATLAELGIQTRILEEPWLGLDHGQAQLLGFIRNAHNAQRRDRIRESLRSATGRVGRPRVRADVPSMAEFRRVHSLRDTAKAFDIGASTCHRLLAAYAQTQRSAQ